MHSIAVPRTTAALPSKRKISLTAASMAIAAGLVVAGSAPIANAALGATGTSYCTSPNPTPRLKVRAKGFFTATPPGRGSSTYYGFSEYATWYGVGSMPGGGWSAWVENGGGFKPDIDRAGTGAYCSPG